MTKRENTTPARRVVRGRGNADPHPKWLAEIRRLEASACAIAAQQLALNDPAGKSARFRRLERKYEVAFDQRWALIDRCAFTRARTIEGAEAQAHLILYLIENDGGSTWTRKEDVRAAKNIAATLSRIGKGRRTCAPSRASTSTP